jgi:peptide/nickel transport system substrate-binding protein
MLFLSLGILLAACQPNFNIISKTPGVQTPDVKIETPTVTVAPSPTPVPPRNLSICLGQEPQTLYPYGSSSRYTWSVLEAVYDGPVDLVNYKPKPVILKNLPDKQDGTYVLKPVTVKRGDQVVDANGDLVNLAPDNTVLPSGCASQSCAVKWDGLAALQMDQVTLNFKLLPDLKWSDGQPLTADDSVFSFELSGDPATPVSKRLFDRTASYKALDETSVEWVGKPGAIPARVDTVFWLPLPRHTWGEIKPADLVTSEQSARKPIGWGPYVIDEWVAGDHIKLSKNPNYFRAAEGFPKFDSLVFRFLGEPMDSNLAALLSGECDVISQASLLEEQIEPILEAQKAGKMQAFFGQGPEWDHLDFGIRPVSYDDNYNPFGGDRPDVFGDIRVRQAINLCVDRQGIVDKLLYKQSSVPATFFPPTHPLYPTDLSAVAYNPEEGGNLLDQAGWKDLDNDPATPRVAAGVLNVPDGTKLELNYMTTEAGLRSKTAEFLSGSLAKCGVQVNVKTMNAGQLFAQGPAGPIFGRKFDLVQFAWEAGAQSPCLVYETAQIPGPKNNWLGANITGYSNPAFDTACEAARRARPDDPDYVKLNQDVATLFAKDLPAIPLYLHPKVVVARPDLCEYTFDVTARTDLTGLETLNYDPTCKK